MTEQAYLLLLALADGRQHGYGLVGAVRELSGGSVQLGAGTLYGNLDRMLAAGLIEAPDAAAERAIPERLGALSVEPPAAQRGDRLPRAVYAFRAGAGAGDRFWRC